MSRRTNLLRIVCGNKLANLSDKCIFWVQRRKVQSGEPAVVPQCNKFRSEPPKNEAVKEHLEGTDERRELVEQITGFLKYPITMPVVFGTEKLYSGCGACYPLVMPFDHAVIGSYFFRPVGSVVDCAIDCAVKEQPCWERLAIEKRCHIFDKAADIMAGEQRQRIIAAQMIGQAMTCIQAEHNLCQLIDYTRINSNFLRDLTTSRCVSKGGKGVTNLNHYHGLEGFFAAITPSDSLSNAAQLAITPAIMGNTVLWKPSDCSLLACYCVLECLIAAGLPPGVINFVPAEQETFLKCICSRKELAGVAFGGTTPALQHIWQCIGHNIHHYNRFPRIAGTGSAKNFHIVHTSADLECATSNTIRAAFEMAGQKTTSCSRVYVHKKILTPFLNLMIKQLKSLLVTHPLDHRCFMSSLISLEAYHRVVSRLLKHSNHTQSKLVFGGRACAQVGYFVEPSVFLLNEDNHPLLRDEIRGPVLAVTAFDDMDDLVKSVGRAPYALCGAVFAEISGPMMVVFIVWITHLSLSDKYVSARVTDAVSTAIKDTIIRALAKDEGIKKYGHGAPLKGVHAQDAEWATDAVTELRDLATMLVVNDRCSEECPAQQSLGGSRLSGTGSKAGSISYLLSYCSERSLREVTELTREVTYPYMRDAAAPQDTPSIKKVKESTDYSD